MPARRGAARRPHGLCPAQFRRARRRAPPGAPGPPPGGFLAFRLHGVTGSGKTEVYLHLIARAIDRARQALALVPEIGLTPQLEARFRHAFPGARLAVLPSGLNDAARTPAWVAAGGGAGGVARG